MSQVARQATPISLPDFANAMVKASSALGYGTPSKDAIAVVWSHFALETGYGQFCWNFNLGNHRWYGPSETPDYVILTGAFECADSVPAGATAAPEHDGSCGGQVAYYPPASSQQFAAFADLKSGMTAYLRFLHDHYPEAFAAMMAGDVSGFSKGLKARGYYTADEPTYTAKLSSIFATALSQVPNVSSFSMGLGFAAIAAAIVTIVWYARKEAPR